ncbi:MAG TPA: hypothetical protein PKH51_12240, partial [Candidatus Sumerlaeota bacterium]|nr:hypothetical protein [Candidatus Sumerlaeota bacterium]
MVKNSNSGTATAMTMRKIPVMLWALMATLMTFSAKPSLAGPGYLVVTRDLADEAEPSDDTFSRMRLKFSDDLPQRFYLYRPVPGAVAEVLDPGVNTTNVIEDDDIKEAVDAAIEEWDDVGGDLELQPSLYSEDGAIPGFTYLERGPFELALDTRNLITFRDANNNLADG